MKDRPLLTVIASAAVLVCLFAILIGLLHLKSLFWPESWTHVQAQPQSPTPAANVSIVPKESAAVPSAQPLQSTQVTRESSAFQNTWAFIHQHMNFATKRGEFETKEEYAVRLKELHKPFSTVIAIDSRTMKYDIDTGQLQVSLVASDFIGDAAYRGDRFLPTGYYDKPIYPAVTLYVDSFNEDNVVGQTAFGVKKSIKQVTWVRTGFLLVTRPVSDLSYTLASVSIKKNRDEAKDLIAHSYLKLSGSFLEGVPKEKWGVIQVSNHSATLDDPEGYSITQSLAPAELTKIELVDSRTMDVIVELPLSKSPKL